MGGTGQAQGAVRTRQRSQQITWRTAGVSRLVSPVYQPADAGRSPLDSSSGKVDLGIIEGRSIGRLITLIAARSPVPDGRAFRLRWNVRRLYGFVAGAATGGEKQTEQHGQDKQSTHEEALLGRRPEHKQGEGWADAMLGPDPPFSSHSGRCGFVKRHEHSITSSNRFDGTLRDGSPGASRAAEPHAFNRTRNQLPIADAS